MAYIEGHTGKWEYVIGLEVHAQISSKSKLFSRSSTEYGSEPNAQVSLIDAAMPGMLPVLNKYCVEQAIKTGIGINGKINKISAFDRKNYFYPDLPQGYQISQFYTPIVEHGYLIILDDEGNDKKININRIHLEQDAGKSVHDYSPEHSLIDLNRAGIALMEIVTEPEISSPQEAADYVRKLRNILRYIGSCNGNMDQGSMRVDANVSIRKAGDALGTRCEIKNLNSVRNIIKAIEYEALRQLEILETGGKVDQETRLYDVTTGQTRAMRTKEDANDYRYFPDPDLLPVKVSDELIEQIKSSMPELPQDKIDRYVGEYSLSKYDASVIVSDLQTAHYYEKALEVKGSNPKMVANWISSELFGRLNKNNQKISDCKIEPQDIGTLTKLIEDGTISGKIAKNIFEEMFETGVNPEVIIEKQGLSQNSDPGEINSMIDNIMAANQDKVEQYKAGKDKLFGFFVGQVMKESKGAANPNLVNDLLKKKLS